MNADTIVRARISAETKRKATVALKGMGLNVSDLIRMTLLRVAEEGCLPFDVKIPNQETQKAIEELEAGKGTQYAHVDDMFKDVLGEKWSIK